MQVRKTFFGLALILLFAFAASLAFAGEFSADMKVTAGAHSQMIKIFVKGAKMRTEMKTPHGAMTAITDTAAQKILLLMPAQKMYMEAGGMAQSMGTPKIPELGKVPKGAKKVGSEKLHGYRCDIYELVDPKAGKAKFWWSKKLGMPVRSESETAMGKAVTELENIKETSQPASLFKVPAGYQKMQMPKMPKAGG